MGAYQRCLEYNYAIECDVHQIEDGTIVCFHDHTLKRLTDKDGYVAQIKSKKDLKNYKLMGTEYTIPTFDELLKLVINEERKDYGCYKILRDLVENNPDFRKKLQEGIAQGKIYGFNEDVWEKIALQNIRNIDSFETVFKKGYNLGNCTPASKQLSYSFRDVEICGGVVDYLIGTQNSPDGSHTWMVSGGEIYDTTLMLVIDETYAKKSFTYDEQNRVDPTRSPIYCATREFTNDPELRPKNR